MHNVLSLMVGPIAILVIIGAVTVARFLMGSPEVMIGYRGRGKMHKWYPLLFNPHDGTGDALCMGYLPKRHLTRLWSKVTCKRCLRKRPKR